MKITEQYDVYEGLHWDVSDCFTKMDSRINVEFYYTGNALRKIKKSLLWQTIFYIIRDHIRDEIS